MRIKITEEERKAMVHFWTGKYELLKRTGGTQCGSLSIEGLENLIARLQTDNYSDPIEIYLLKDHCPVCDVKLCYEATCYCPQCGEEWWGDKALKMFW